MLLLPQGFDRLHLLHLWSTGKGCHFLNNPCLVTVSSATEHRQQNQPGSRKVRAETCSSHFHPRNPHSKGSYTMAAGLFTSCLENSFNSVQCLYTVFTGNSTLLVTQKYVIHDAVSLMMNATCLYISDKYLQHKDTTHDLLFSHRDLAATSQRPKPTSVIHMSHCNFKLAVFLQFHFTCPGNNEIFILMPVKLWEELRDLCFLEFLICRCGQLVTRRVHATITLIIL